MHNGRLVPHGEQLNLPIVAFPALHALQNLHIPADCCISCCAQEMCFLARLLGVHTDVEQCRSDAATFGPKMEQGKWGSGHHKRLPQFILGLAPWHKKVAVMTTPSGGVQLYDVASLLDDVASLFCDVALFFVMLRDIFALTPL